MDTLIQLFNTLLQFLSELGATLKVQLSSATLAGTLGTLVIVFVVVVVMLYLSQGALFFLQRVLEAARVLIKVVAILVLVVAVIVGGRAGWEWYKSNQRTCTGAFFEKVLPCTPLDLRPKAAPVETKSALSVKKERNAIKPSVKEKVKHRKSHKKEN